MPLRIVYVTVQSVDASLFREPAEEVCRENDWDLDLFCANDSDIDENPLLYHELALRTKTADLVLVRVMADPTRMRRFEQWEKVLKECPGYVHVYSGNLEVSLVYRDLFKGDDREYMRLREFVRGRGAENDRAIVQWVHHEVTGEGDVPDPVEHRPNGIYHPDFDRDVTLDEYLAHLDPSKPTIGLMFTANLWIYGNLEHIDAFIRETESQGMNVIPVFFSSVASRTDGNEGSVAVVREYFTEGHGDPVLPAQQLQGLLRRLHPGRAELLPHAHRRARVPGHVGVLPFRRLRGERRGAVEGRLRHERHLAGG